MGCGGSSANAPTGAGGNPAVSDPEEEKLDWDNASIDDEWKDEEMRSKPKKLNQKTNEIEDREDPEDREFDFFEGADAGSGEQFMAVRPYAGAIIEPTNHNDFSKKAPDVCYELDYVYGYRAEDSRMNAYYNKDAHVAYFTAAVGVILDQSKNEQCFFGGGQVDNTSKKVASDNNCHTNDITSMGISYCRTLAATGQNGSRPVAFVWDSCTGEKKGRFKLEKGMREITAIGICPLNEKVAMVDNNNDHNLWIFDISSGKQMVKTSTGVDRIYQLDWSKKEGENHICVAGSKHVSFWDLDASKLKKKKGLYMSKGRPTSHCCASWCDNGNCYTGGANSHIYVWRDRCLVKNYDVHGRGFVCAIRWIDGKIISGAKDGKVVISDPHKGTCEREIDVNCLVRSVDMYKGCILAGLRNGCLLEINEKDEQNIIMRSHSTGEAWGLGMVDDSCFITSGDDNKAFTWNIDHKGCIDEAIVCDVRAQPKSGGASTMSDYAPSECGRAVAVNCHGNGHVAIGHNDGRVTIRTGAKKLGDVIHTLQDSDEWIECMSYSPDGTKLAVGSHDNNIYVYDTTSYKCCGKCTKHNSFIVSVDWSECGKYIRSVCGAHELLFFNGETCDQETSGASDTVETVWQTCSAKYGWLVSGIFPACTDGTHINHVDFSKDGKLIVTGDDYGLVNVWCNPACSGATPISLRGHSEHVVRTYFARGCDFIISIGGYDKTIMQWKKK
jgi:WD40 repeat protein